MLDAKKSSGNQGRSRSQDYAYAKHHRRADYAIEYGTPRFFGLFGITSGGHIFNTAPNDEDYRDYYADEYHEITDSFD